MKKNVLKKLVVLAVTSALLVGCGNSGEYQQQRVGSKVPERFEETNQEAEPENVKAKNFKYDKDNMDYRLVWSDEFEYEGAPDEEKWGYEVGDEGWGNNELQYQTKGDNAWVENGNLVIELRKELM